MNENEMNFQYLNVLDVEFLNSIFESKEAVLSVDKTILKNAVMNRKLKKQKQVQKG